MEEGKVAPILGLQPLVLEKHKLMLAELRAKLTLAIRSQLCQGGVREDERPLKTIKN